jgi:hypothetical protein
MNGLDVTLELIGVFVASAIFIIGVIVWNSEDE